MLGPYPTPASSHVTLRILYRSSSQAYYGDSRHPGLVCRADDRGDPVIQLAPPLICGQEHFDEMKQILRAVLTGAWTGI
jgi:adenosylmethionine-8-amino-7-oxononanoate aminotransferase